MAGKLKLSVSQLGEYVRRTLQMDPMLHGIELRGEISNLKFHQTGTLFFTLKDEQAAISCVMYADDVQELSGMPFEGMRALASGSVGYYVRGGQLQFYANRLRAEGVGVLYERLLMLKTKLSQEGLFDKEKKRSLPLYPDTIGVVTSPTGAVIHDILNVSLRRDPQSRILLCPVRVQGIGSADEVTRAIRLLEQLDNVSVIIVARGGGSMEDLWTFNEESVVRAVAACTKPIVSAVGHETDVTLCDLAADLRAPTPSAAAECVVPRRDERVERIRLLRTALDDAAHAHLDKREMALHLAKARLSLLRPAQRMQHSAQRFERCRHALDEAISVRMLRCEEQIVQRRRELEMLSPYRVLSRGYAMVLKDGKPVRSAAQLAEGDVATLRFAGDQAMIRVIQACDQEDGK